MWRVNKHKISFSNSGKKYHIITLFLIILLVILCVLNSLDYGMDIQHWDFLLISGVLVFIPAVYMAFSIPDKLSEMLNRLVHRGTLETSTERLSALKNELQKIAGQWSKRSGTILAIVLFISFLLAFGFPLPAIKIPITLIEVAGGFVAGAFLGHMAGYGRLGWLLKKEGLKLKIQPGHIDGVAGLRPVGEFYFRQAMLTALPALFLSAWLLIIMLWPTRYDSWRTPYALLLLLALIFEVLVFLIPLLSFRREMIRQKKLFLQDADELSKKINAIEGELITEQDASQRDLLKDRLLSITNQYWHLENMPIWPLSLKTKRLFKRNNVALALPLIIHLVSKTNLGKSQLWQKAAEMIQKIV